MQDMFSSRLPEDADADADPVSDFPHFDVISPSDEQVAINVFVDGGGASDSDDCVGGGIHCDDDAACLDLYRFCLCLIQCCSSNCILRALNFKAS